MKRFTILIIALAQLSRGEDVTLVAENQADQAGYSQTLTLNQGESGKLLFFSGTTNLSIICTVGSKTFNIAPWRTIAVTSNGTHLDEVNPVTVAGPATIVLKAGGIGNSAGSGFLTFEVTRAGIASPPAAIPQEAETTWDVILEQSSDLINWTPANPGAYSGTEPKRFFRTRMVKKP